jgi:antitoxin YefM
MKHVNYSFFRNNMASVLDKVHEDHLPVIITRQNSKPAVVISLEDFNAYEETAYLMASKKNRKRLDQAIQEIEQGNVIINDIVAE